MDNLPNSVEAWTWWVISVVIMGLIVNLLSSFLNPRIEAILAQNSEKRRHQLQIKRQEFQQSVTDLVAHPQKIPSLKIDLILLHLRAVLYVAIALILIEIMSSFIEAVFIYEFLFLGVTIGIFTIILTLLNDIREINNLIRAAEEQHNTLAS